jgi:Spy/CpxP family protein refolding chaperone
MKALCSISVMVAAVALLALSAPMPAFSAMKDMAMQQHRGGYGQRMEMCNLDRMDDMMGMCCEHAGKLGLTDEQTLKMKPIHSEMQKKQARFQADLKIAQIELKDIMDVKDFDLEKASATVKKIEEIKTAHHLEMLTAMKEMRNILTDEQFKNMKKMMPMERGKKRPAKRMNKKHSDK